MKKQVDMNAALLRAKRAVGNLADDVRISPTKGQILVRIALSAGEPQIAPSLLDFNIVGATVTDLYFYISYAPKRGRFIVSET